MQRKDSIPKAIGQGDYKFNPDHIQVMIENVGGHSYRASLWGIDTNGVFPKSIPKKHYQIGYLSGKVIVGGTELPWVAECPLYIRKMNVHPNQSQWQNVSNVASSITQSVERELAKLPRILRIRTNGMYHTNWGYYYRQDLRMGPRFAVRPSGTIRHPGIWVGGKMVLSVPLNWVTLDGLWRDPQYEYLAREAMIEYENSL